jgi:hypothetical protein
LIWQQAAFWHPTAECDLVMKEGVTEGLSTLSDAGVGSKSPNDGKCKGYRFRNNGGTSASAIAAAITAAQ